MDTKLKKLIKKYNDVFETIDNGKLRCTLTKHEIPARFDVLKAYVETKKFKEQNGLHKLMSEYEEIFTDNGDGTVTCTVSNAKIAKRPGDIERYLKGKNFAQAVEKMREQKLAAEAAEDEETDADETMGDESDEEEVPMLIASDEDIETKEEPEPVKKTLKRKAAPIKKTPTGRAKKKKIVSKK